jgi:hypothetical protein
MGEGLVVEREFGGATVRYGVRLPDETRIDVVQPSAHLIPLDTVVRIDALPAAPVVFTASEQRRINTSAPPVMIG